MGIFGDAPEIGEKQKRDSAEGAETDRLNLQCYLADNFQTYARASTNPKGYGGGKIFSCVMGNPTDVLQKLTTKPGREAFLGLTNDKFAFLVPTVRLFRVSVDPITKKASTESSKKREIKFKTFTDDTQVASMTSNRGMRGDQVGLKEMTYELEQGGGGSTTGKRQKITIKFTADSLAALDRSGLLDLVLHPQARTYKYDKHGKKIAGQRRPSQDFFAVQIVYGWSAPRNTTALSFTASERKAIAQSTNTLTLTLTSHELSFNDDGSIEIEAEYMGYADAKLGQLSTNILWSDPEQQNLIRDEQKKLDAAQAKEEAAEASRKESAKKVDDAQKTSKEAYEATANAGDDKTRSKEYKKALQADNDKIAALEDLAAKDKAEQEYERKVVEQEANVAKQVQADRQEKYNRVIQALIDSKKIWFIDVDPEKVGRIRTREVRGIAEGAKKYIGGEDPPLRDDGKVGKVKRKAKLSPAQYEALSDKQKAEYDAGRMFSGTDEGDRPKAPPPQKGGDPSTLDKAKKATEEHSKNKVAEAEAKHEDKKAEKGILAKIGITSDEEEDAKEDTKDNLENFHAGNTAKSSPTDGKVRLNYMYWGDILAQVLKTAYRGKSLPIRYLVGTMNFTDPRTGKAATVNIADIPISLNLFSTWWIKKIVAPGRDVYTIRQFIRDSINELILAAIGDDCYEGAPSFGPVGGSASRNPLEPPRIEFTTIAAALGDGQKDRIANKGRVSLAGDDFKQYQRAQRNNAHEYSQPENQVEYIYIYCNAWTKSDLSGNYKADKARGIYHVSIGQDAGPIKKISFEKDQELSELMATQAQMNGYGISQLVASYTAKISMIGNTIWIPGNYLHISPSALGVSAAAANAMGLGGYYTVLNINGKIDSNGWSSDLEAYPLFQTAAERRGAKIGGTTQALDSLSPAKQNKSPEKK